MQVRAGDETSPRPFGLRVCARSDLLQSQESRVPSDAINGEPALPLEIAYGHLSCDTPLPVHMQLRRT